MWLSATYPSSNTTSINPPRSEAVIWDTIINSHSQSHPFNLITYFQSSKTTSKSSKAKKTSQKKPAPEIAPGRIDLKNVKPKYQITDITGKLAERQDVVLQVGWNVQPWVGALTWTLGDGLTFGRWNGIKGGKSKVFELPALKSKSASSETVISSGGTPKAAKASAVV